MVTITVIGDDGVFVFSSIKALQLDGDEVGGTLAGLTVTGEKVVLEDVILDYDSWRELMGYIAYKVKKNEEVVLDFTSGGVFSCVMSYSNFVVPLYVVSIPRKCILNDTKPFYVLSAFAHDREYVLRACLAQLGLTQFQSFLYDLEPVFLTRDVDYAAVLGHHLVNSGDSELSVALVGTYSDRPELSESWALELLGRTLNEEDTCAEPVESVRLMRVF